MIKLENYKNNRIELSDLMDCVCYETIYSFKTDATDEEVQIITGACTDVWLHDEENYSICKYADFLSENYFNGNITLDDISNASHWDIMNDVINDSLHDIKNVDEMER